MALAVFPLLSLTTDAAKYDVFVAGKKAGVATYETEPKRGGRWTRLRVALADGSVSESVSETDAMGAAVRAVETVKRKGSTRVETITYSPRGDATIVVDHGKPVVVPFDRRGSRRDPSELWLRPTVPSGNTWAIYRALNSRKRTWEEVRVTFVGKKDVGYVIEQKRSGATTRFVMDAKGVPMTIEAGSLRMVRR